VEMGAIKQQSSRRLVDIHAYFSQI